jgi:hypothetical protein
VHATLCTSLDGEVQVSLQSAHADGSDKFFTIDESYCPTMQNHSLHFDQVIRETLIYYIENVRSFVCGHRRILAHFSERNSSGCTSITCPVSEIERE